MHTLKMIAALMFLFWWPLLLCAAGLSALWLQPELGFWWGTLAGLFVAWSIVTWARWAAERFK